MHHRRWWLLSQHQEAARRAALMRVTPFAWAECCLVPRSVPDPKKVGVGEQNAVGGEVC